MSNLLPGLRVVVESIHNNLEADCIKRLNKNATSLLKNNLTFKNKETLQWKSSSKIPRGKQVSPRKRKTTKKKKTTKNRKNKQNKQTNRTSYPLPHAFMRDTIMHNIAQETSTSKA